MAAALATLRVLRLNTYIFRRIIFKHASTYEGEGKTTAKILNHEMDYLMIDAVSNIGFLLNNGLRLIGPSILFPRTFLSWNISGLSDINDDSLSIFPLLYPSFDILILGYGNPKTMTKEKNDELTQFSKKHGFCLELLPTENAVATFNYLNNEKRLVAAALIPPTEIKLYNDEDNRNFHSRKLLLDGD